MDDHTKIEKMDAELDAEAEGLDARREALKRDTGKLLNWMNAVNDVPKPEIKDHLADVAFSWAVIQVNIALKNLRKSIEGL